MITYTENASISSEEAIDLYIRSTLGERRPIDNIETFAAMLAHANLTISAWDGEKLVGISRNLTDFAYVAYLADLAVDEQYQRQGIGKRLIEETKARLGPDCMIVLLAAPKANDYYEHLGFEHNPRAWMIKNNSI
jgi:predicted N-acetyltransferase YhbS